MEYLIGLGFIFSGASVLAVIIIGVLALIACFAWLYDACTSEKVKRWEIPMWIGHFFNWCLDGIMILAILFASYAIGKHIWLG